MNHETSRDSFKSARQNNAEPNVAGAIAVADAVNRLADAAERIAKSLESVSTVSESVNRVLTDPLLAVTWIRQLNKIGENLDEADKEHRERGEKDIFARALGMTDAELAT